MSRPALDVKKSGPNEGFLVPYGNKRLLEALKLLLETESDADGYWYDAVDLLRQVLSNYAQDLQRQTAQAFKNREQEAFDACAGAFLELLEDVDALLDGREEFSLGKWIREACRWGQTEAEQDLYEYNAGVLLTLWGEAEEPRIFDYSWREWSGMISGFYKVRWEKFFGIFCADICRRERNITVWGWNRCMDGKRFAQMRFIKTLPHLKWHGRGSAKRFRRRNAADWIRPVGCWENMRMLLYHKIQNLKRFYLDNKKEIGYSGTK